jgi:hypothetical protein
MKKYIISAFIALLQMYVVKAQQLFEDFGVISPEEKSVKVCDFDKEAEAVYLRHEAVVDHDEDMNMITVNRVRIKILKESGIKYADVKIPFYSYDNFEKIQDVKAMVINFDAEGNKQFSLLESKYVYTRKKDQYYSEVSFAIPGVKEGSIIEYTYKSFMENYSGLDRWYFQHEIPVYFSSFSVTIMPNAEFAYQAFVSPGYTKNINVIRQENLGKYVYQMKNIPGLRSEPFMDAPKDYLQRIEFQLSSIGSGLDRRRFMNSWDDVANDLLRNSYFGVQLEKNLPGTEDVVKAAMLKADHIEKVKTIFSYVQNRMAWNGYYGKYAIDGVKTPWDKKTGSTGEINLILINLLKSARLEVYPLLVSERDHGKVNKEYPFIDQFNKVVAYVQAGNKPMILDATDKTTPPEIIPFQLLNTTAFIVHRKKGGLIEIQDNLKGDRVNINVSGKVQPDGTLSGEALVINTGYARLRSAPEIKSNKESYISETFIKPYNTIRIDSFKIENLEADTLPLKSHALFNYHLQSTGDYKFINLNLFAGLEKNPFVQDYRFTNINFGTNRNISLSHAYKIPGEYTVDAMPKNISLIMPDTSILFSRKVFSEETSGQIIARIRIDFNRSLFKAPEYPIVKDFYKKLFDLLNEPIVLKKK